MKASTFLIAILMLLLSLKPCSDGNNSEDLKKDTKSLTHNHQQDDDDSCAATCICSCCGMSVTFESIKTYTFKLRIAIPNSPIPSYTSNYQFDTVASIWQPPQLIS
jgi:hypothetical protein